MPARLRLNLFSPLPPVHSEIGNHTVTVARALQALADVTLWTPRGAQDPDTRIEDLPVIRFDPAAMDWRRLNQADCSVYNIGNNATFHRAIFDVARVCPGIVVLHDTRLQHFFARYSETPGADRTFYLDSIRRCHGPAALADAQAWLAGEHPIEVLVERHPMTLAAIKPAIAAVVHNPAEQRSLMEQTATPVFYLPLACEAGALPPRTPPNGILRLIVFGFLGPNRQLDTVLSMLADLPDRDVTLDIYGAIEDAAPFDARIAALGLEGRVTRHGFVTDAELQAALARADLAINLRFPSMGEASASQLRIWAAGLPSVVTRTGWYATLPEDAVAFVDPGREAEMLRSHLEALRGDPERFRRAGLRGRDLVERRHDPAGYASGLLDIVGQSAVLHARHHAMTLSRRTAAALLEFGDSTAAALCVDHAADAIANLTRA